MISLENRELLKGLSKTQYGKALREFLEERYEAIGDITTCKSWEETVGRQFAIITLKEMFSFMDEKEVKPKPPTQYS